MPYRQRIVFSLLLSVCMPAGGKDKNKVVLPVHVLQAQTVLVVTDPDAGTAIDAPMANRKAQEDVEKALMNWGRFRIAINLSDADIIITVRKGNGKMVQPTVGGIPTNNRPVIFEPTDSGGRGGVKTGTSPLPGDPTSAQPGSPYPQAEGGSTQDMFVVYRGQRSDPLDSPPVWRYTAKDALRSPGVPAVDEFRKAIIEAEKQLGNKP
jgi:hypothetical protein